MAAAPLALGQSNNTTSDPTLNASDFDNSTPPADDSYLNDTNASTSGNSTSGDPTLNESDMDTSVPSTDASYLGDGSSGTPTGASAAGTKGTPGFESVILVVGVAAVAMALRRR